MLCMGAGRVKLQLCILKYKGTQYSKAAFSTPSPPNFYVNATNSNEVGSNPRGIYNILQTFKDNVSIEMLTFKFSKRMGWIIYTQYCHSLKRAVVSDLQTKYLFCSAVQFPLNSTPLSESTFIFRRRKWKKSDHAEMVQKFQRPYDKSFLVKIIKYTVCKKKRCPRQGFHKGFNSSLRFLNHF